MKDYTEKVDMWSLGCILAELYLGEPLFMTAHNRNHLMDLIVSKTGSPTDEYWPEMKGLPFYNELYPKKHYDPSLRNYLFKKKTK